MDNIMIFSIELVKKIINLTNQVYNFFTSDINILGYLISPLEMLFGAFGVFFLAWLVKKIVPLT